MRTSELIWKLVPSVSTIIAKKSFSPFVLPTVLTGYYFLQILEPRLADEPQDSKLGTLSDLKTSNNFQKLFLHPTCRQRKGMTG